VRRERAWPECDNEEERAKSEGKEESTGRSNEEDGPLTRLFIHLASSRPTVSGIGSGVRSVIAEYAQRLRHISRDGLVSHGRVCVFNPQSDQSDGSGRCSVDRDEPKWRETAFETAEALTINTLMCLAMHQRPGRNRELSKRVNRSPETGGQTVQTGGRPMRAMMIG
jgi:hypothetical protein